MDNDPQIEPVQTLGYYQPQRSGALPSLVRLVLLAGAASALAMAVSLFPTLLMLWPRFGGSLGKLSLSPIEVFGCGVYVVAFLSPATASIGCVVLLRTTSARTFTIWAEIGIIASKACFAGFALYDYASSRQAHFPGFWSYPNIIQETADFLPPVMLPALILVMLLRNDVHRSGATSR